MSTAQDENWLENREHWVDPVYESIQEIHKELSREYEESPVERYDWIEDGIDYANFLRDVVMLGEDEVSRVLEEMENPKCPYCEVENKLEDSNTDPTLESMWGSTYEEAQHRPEHDEKVKHWLSLSCSTHLDAWLERTETEYE